MGSSGSTFGIAAASGEVETVAVVVDVEAGGTAAVPASERPSDDEDDDANNDDDDDDDDDEDAGVDEE